MKKAKNQEAWSWRCPYILLMFSTKGSWWAIDWHILIAPRSWRYMELSSRPPRWHPPSLIQPLFIIVYSTCVHWWPGWQLYPGFVWAAVFSKNLLNKVQIEIKTTTNSMSMSTNLKQLQLWYFYVYLSSLKVCGTTSFKQGPYEIPTNFQFKIF